jgi:cell fate regulator YaaT (PSP1 superfamily)
MPKIVGVRFKPVSKIYYFDPNNITDLGSEDWVIVETARGMELGGVALPMRDVPESELKGELKPVVRRATPLDLLMAQEHKGMEPAAVDVCKQLVQEMDISMKVVQASYSFDGSRLMFSFTSEQRVDFRDLVKELAKSLKTRIEMKQIGARDEAKLIDGYGRCGQRLCCSSWLTEFHPVSIRMAKQQGLPLAPSEISGLCGRLLCCLAYEDKMYAEMKLSLPQVGTRVKLDEGMGVIRGLNIIREMVIVEFDDADARYVEVPISAIEIVKSKLKMQG